MRRQIDRLEAGFNCFIFFLASLSAVLIALYAVLIPLNLFLIKTQLGNIFWIYEVVEYSLYVGAFIGAPWVLQKGAHVRIDVLLQALPKSAATRLDHFINLFGSALCLFLCFYGVRATCAEFQDGTMPDKVIQIKNWYMMAVFALSFFLLSIEFLLRFRRMAAREKDVASEAGF